ncbi:MAG: hypothetical protein AAGJ31_08810, partial [Verrucomicrobiota bacterium]
MESSFRLASLLVSLFPLLLLGQQGNRDGHVMTPPPADWIVPAPVRQPQETMESYVFGEKGFVLELVAAEPLVENPVTLSFDGNGRAWVCEMRDYMPNVNGTNEDAKNGRISILLDADGDGQADESIPFLEGLDQPRALQFVNGGILWADQLKLYFTERRGQEGLEAGETVVVDAQFCPGGNVEHKGNGLLYGLDNWIYSAKSDKKFRKVGETWREAPTESRGQWGIAQDDWGRLLTNTNSNLVAMETIAPGYESRNPDYEFASKVGRKLSSNAVFPARITCGINRGYLDSMLDERGYLKKATACGGLTLYRGDQFPKEYYGNVFVPEPAGLLLKRVLLSEENGLIEAKQAYADKEFLTSVDERSRLVNSQTGPDGTLYLVDLYHGIIQHRTYVTTYLREQIVGRGLEQENNHRGRIYRVRWAGSKVKVGLELETASTGERVKALSHPNGFWRDTAQRLLVQSRDETAVPALRKLLSEKNGMLQARALWTLEGLGSVEENDVITVLSSKEPQAVIQAIRVGELLYDSSPSRSLLRALEKVHEHEAIEVRRQLLATLGSIPEATESWLALTGSLRDDRLAVDLAISTISGREKDLVGPTLAAGLSSVSESLAKVTISRGAKEEIEGVIAALKNERVDGRSGVIRTMGREAVTEKNVKAVKLLLTAAAGQPELESALISGMIKGGTSKGFKKIKLEEAPDLL